MLWSEFAGRANTDEVLREKASLIASIFEAGAGKFILLSSTREHSSYSETQKILSATEMVALYIRALDEFVLLYLAESEAELLTRSVVSLLEESLEKRNHLYPSVKLVALFRERVEALVGLGKLVPPAGASAKGTAMWESLKYQSNILQLSPDGILLSVASHSILTYVSRWDLRGLLTGR